MDQDKRSASPEANGNSNNNQAAQGKQPTAVASNQYNERKFTEQESNILVAIRVRPLNQKEENQGDFDTIRVEDKLIIVLDPIEMEFANENKKMLEVYHRSKEQRYAFDKIFRHHTQEEVYQQTCRHLIKPVIQGFNATVFAYGPTGTGKTYTMLGYHDTQGLCTLTIQDIFTYIRKDTENEYSVTITYVEIYNETIRDLLVPHSTYLELRDDPLKGITIAGVQECKAESTEQVMNLLFTGNKRRTTESTNANQTSSRSHAVFQVTVGSRSRTKNTEQENLCGKLSLIDLAGSERGTVTENRGIRLREGAKINQSLLALANCINALGDKSKKGFFVPYRDSKLTRMLKDSLGGNCKTVMIANVSPSSAQFEETINTLKYANRAKNIKTKVSANKRLVSVHIAEYKNIINDLRSEIEQLKAKLHEKIGDNSEILTFQEEEQQYLEKQHLQHFPSDKSSNCTCGRVDEEASMRKIQEEIFENFQNRIQLRRGLMEIEEQNAMNVLEIKKKQAEILVAKKEAAAAAASSGQSPDENGKKSPSTDHIKNLVRSVRTLRVSTEKNSIRKEMMTLSLLENITNAKVIRDSIPKKISFQDRRNYLELVIKNHVLELQNIEMEINLQIQEKTILDLKNIIASQRNIIQEHHIATAAAEGRDENAVYFDQQQQDDQDEGDDIDLEDEDFNDEDEEEDFDDDDDDDQDQQQQNQNQDDDDFPETHQLGDAGKLKEGSPKIVDNNPAYNRVSRKDEQDRNNNNINNGNRQRGSSRTDGVLDSNANNNRRDRSQNRNPGGLKGIALNENDAGIIGGDDDNFGESVSSQTPKNNNNSGPIPSNQRRDDKRVQQFPPNLPVNPAAIDPKKKVTSVNQPAQQMKPGVPKKKENMGGLPQSNAQIGNFQGISITGQGQGQGVSSQKEIQNSGMPLIQKPAQQSQQPYQQSQQAQQAQNKDFSGLNLKGKNIILPVLSGAGSNQSNIQMNQGNINNNASKDTKLKKR